MAELTTQWDKIMEARAGLIACCEMVAIRNYLPRQSMLELAELLVSQDKAVRGNRPKSDPPTWDDAKLVLEATMRYCSKFLEQIA